MFYDIFEELCQKKGVLPRTATTEMGLSNSLSTKWKKTGATPRGETLKKVAAYFGVTESYLLRDEKNQPTGTITDELTSDEQELLRYYREMNENGKLSALMSVKGMSEQDLFKKERNIDAEH